MVLALVALINPAARGAAAPAAGGVGEYVTMCREIEAAVTTGDGEAFDRYFDLETFLEAVSVGMNPEMRAGFKEGMRQTLRIGRQMHDSLGPSGHYRLLRMHSVNGAPRALFRTVGQQGLNYHDLVLGRDKAQKVCFTDFYAYASGELMSDTIKHLTAQIVPPQPGQPLDPESAALLRIGEVRQLVAANRGREAVDLLNTMPAKTQQLKIMQLLRVTAAVQISEPEYMKALESYRKLFGDDPSADLVSLDMHLMKKSYDQFFAAVDRLDKAVGGDPYLDTMRCAVYVETGDLATARKCADKSATADPKLFEAQDALLTVAIKQKDHPTTVKQLDLMERDFGLKWKDLRTVDMFADFVKSPQYQDWAKRHPGS